MLCEAFLTWINYYNINIDAFVWIMQKNKKKKRRRNSSIEIPESSSAQGALLPEQTGLKIWEIPATAHGAIRQRLMEMNHFQRVYKQKQTRPWWHQGAWIKVKCGRHLKKHMMNTAGETQTLLIVSALGSFSHNWLRILHYNISLTLSCWPMGFRFHFGLNLFMPPSSSSLASVSPFLPRSLRPG